MQNDGGANVGVEVDLGNHGANELVVSLRRVEWSLLSAWRYWGDVGVWMVCDGLLRETMSVGIGEQLSYWRLVEELFRSNSLANIGLLYYSF